MILYFAADLMWASKLKSHAAELGLAARPVRSVEMLDARMADTEPTGILLDLDDPDISLTLLRHLRREGASARERALRVVAFGPHVAVERFAEAKAIGGPNTTVLARGALVRRLGEVLTGLAKGAKMEDQTTD